MLFQILPPFILLLFNQPTNHTTNITTCSVIATRVNAHSLVNASPKVNGRRLVAHEHALVVKDEIWVLVVRKNQWKETEAALRARR